MIRALSIVVLLALGMSPALAAKKQVCRDATTGQYVSSSYAKKFPGLTVCTAKK